MARSFNGSSDFWSVASAIVASVPITLAVRFTLNSITVTQTFVRQWNSGNNSTRFLHYGGAAANDPMEMHTSWDGVGGEVISQNTGGPATGVYHTMIGRQASATSRTLRYNGTNTAGGGTSLSPGVDRVDIGRYSSGGNYVNGNLADIAFWSAGLTDDECVSFERGFSPKRIRPQSLVACWRAVRDIHDIRSAIAVTVNGSTAAAHPRSYGH